MKVEKAKIPLELLSWRSSRIAAENAHCSLIPVL